jgi:hypothetical protein
MLHLDSTSVIDPDGPLDLVRLAAVVRNIETKYPWNTGNYWAHQGYLGTDVKEKVPMIVKLGGSVLMLDRRLLLALDGEWDEKRSVGAYAGAEVKITSMFALRGGLARGEPAFGVGASSKVGEMHMQIDLAVEQSQNIGDWETIVGLIISN